MATVTVTPVPQPDPPPRTFTVVLSEDEAAYVRTVIGTKNQANVFAKNGKVSPAGVLKETVYGALTEAGVKRWIR